MADQLGPSAFNKFDWYDLNFAAQPISYKWFQVAKAGEGGAVVVKWLKLDM